MTAIKLFNLDAGSAIEIWEAPRHWKSLFKA